MTDPAARLTVPRQSGFEDVYCDADKATALPEFQLPIAAVLPTILIVCPNWVVARTLKVTATEVAIVHPADVVVGDPLEVDTGLPGVVDGMPPAGVWLGGKADVGAVEYVPNAVVATQAPGTTVADGTIHGYGTTEFLLAAIVKKAAYDQVRSAAESGEPLERENCSASDPSASEYWATMLTYPSAYVLTAL